MIFLNNFGFLSIRDGVKVIILFCDLIGYKVGNEWWGCLSVLEVGVGRLLKIFVGLFSFIWWRWSKVLRL